MLRFFDAAALATPRYDIYVDYVYAADARDAAIEVR